MLQFCVLLSVRLRENPPVASEKLAGFYCDITNECPLCREDTSLRIKVSVCPLVNRLK